MSFVEGQRVRVLHHEIPSLRARPGPHPLVGHFGHVTGFDGDWPLVVISHGPDGGPIDPFVLEANQNDATDVWPLKPHEIEAVD
jgi:hypothetical protein